VTSSKTASPTTRTTSNHRPDNEVGEMNRTYG
jgi:hypothetical protein